MFALSPDAVLKRFELVSGYDKERVSRYALMALDCVDTFSSRLPDKEYDETEQRRLIHACAVYAYYRVSLCFENERVSGFKAGDIQFSTERGENPALAMWRQEMEEIADIADLSGDFHFCGVRA